MKLSAFPYPGGKTNYVDEILQYFPEHRRYVEPFGGSAAVLLNKPESYIEVFNDRDEDIVHFFEVVRERREELAEWLRYVPYSRAVHAEWAREFYAGVRPDDDIERAGRWFYLRYTQYGGKIAGISGFKTSGKRNEARSFRGSIDHLEEIVGRLQLVNLECEDYRTILERYDRPDTLFYCDPPYVDKGHYYDASDFDHEALFRALFDLEGYWIVSYDALPAVPIPRKHVDNLHFREFQAHYSLDVRENEGRTPSTERLVLNSDPSEVDEFTAADQQTFDDFRVQHRATRTDGGGRP
ncbi:DNA adenine methylase [Natronobacterium gregoryi]|uniref:DNA methyltransferase n=2 Tax=Natronobacterium gregoryi TaxID=44930 RepID=L0ADA2_NATGS|nr:DNA adenine methylase [Natronobacterium gregoryi]AFZ71414.1 site-specific DNA methylase [Natronobacterium gregoryi SP2]ELY66940.1 D12 class N6 adenine-specific DNA methyltransferase [Natronobacterium gregoryi SP2]PLK21205.1 DNA methyltransferase [Natronobacterium gregoryi SP2]SFI84341.1 DNA adenine methylase [Natronobacterium gregoryi]